MINGFTGGDAGSDFEAKFQANWRKTIAKQLARHAMPRAVTDEVADLSYKAACDAITRVHEVCDLASCPRAQLTAASLGLSLLHQMVAVMVDEMLEKATADGMTVGRFAMNGAAL